MFIKGLASPLQSTDPDLPLLFHWLHFSLQSPLGSFVVENPIEQPAYTHSPGASCILI